MPTSIFPTGKTKRNKYLPLFNYYSDKISEQEEILRAAQKLKDEVLRKLLEDFNNVEEDPLSGD